MPQLSQRSAVMPASPIRKLVPFAVAAKKKGIKVYHLNIGQPDIQTPEQGLDALRHIDRKVLEYSPTPGIQSYRDKLVNYYAKYNINLTPDNIFITCGGSEAVMFAYMACLNPGDEIIIPEPAYANYMGFACETGVVVRTITTHIEVGFALPEAEEFERLITPSHPRHHDLQPQQPHGHALQR